MADPTGTSSPVVVVGTGPAGLAAAMALTRSGVPVRVVERSGLLGGKVNSHKESGRSLEHGVHGWWMNYLNFDRLLRWSDVMSANVFKQAEGSVLLTPDGKRQPLQTLSWDLPSPLFFVLQILRSSFLSFGDLVRTIRFGIHAMAFNPDYDYQRYDGFSFQQLMDATGVSPKIQKLLLEPFILSFDFTTPDRVSAACGLSGLQFYVLRDQHSIISRWPKGLPAEVIFEPIAAKIERQGARFSLSTALQSAVIKDNKVTGVRLEERRQEAAPPPAGLIAAGIIFYGHHHGTSGLINRQHAIMAFLFILTGLTWLAARFIPLLEPLKFSWPMLFGILAYMFVTHKQQDDHEHGAHGHEHEGDGHEHGHVEG